MNIFKFFWNNINKIDEIFLIFKKLKLNRIKEEIKKLIN